jgi:holo-[acyl-carrier protein] synthase
MSIRGIGTDIVEIERIEKQKPAFFERVFTPAEIAYCRSQAQPALHFAARFAAKEAAVKALNWIGRTPTITQIEVVRDEESGAPALKIVPGHYGEDPPAVPVGLRLHVSLSHEKSHAVATVVAEEL